MTWHLRKINIKNMFFVQLQLLILLFFVGSCTSYSTVTYFEPSSTPQIKLYSTGRGPKEAIEAQLSTRVKLRLTIFDKAESGLIRVMIEVPQGSYVRFLKNEFKLLDEKNTKMATAVIRNIQYNDIRNGIGHLESISPQDTLRGATYEAESTFGGAVVAPRTFEIEALTDKAPPDYFLLSIPELEIDNTSLQFFPIPYHKKQGQFFKIIPAQ